MQIINTIFELIKALSAWIIENRATAEGRSVLFALGMSITISVASSFYTYTLGVEQQEEKDKIEFEKRDEKIFSLEGKVDTLQTKLANRDCTEEIKRWRSLFDGLYEQTAKRVDELEGVKVKELYEVKQVEDLNKREKSKTQELLNLKNNLQ